MFRIGVAQRDFDQSSRAQRANLLAGHKAEAHRGVVPNDVRVALKRENPQLDDAQQTCPSLSIGRRTAGTQARLNIPSRGSIQFLSVRDNSEGHGQIVIHSNFA